MPTPLPPLPESYSADFLRQHCRDILAFYNPRVVDPAGGYFQNYYDDGRLFQRGFRQLVSSTRIIVNYARASRELAATPAEAAQYRAVARHGLQYLQQVHYQGATAQYAWTLQDHQPQCMTQQAYGYAFVLLAYAHVQWAGVADVKTELAQTWQLLEQRFWQSEFGLYADEMSADGVLSDYRGQNANMHLCEAMLAAYQATGEAHYLARAQLLAHNITARQAALSGGQVWEHYTPAFALDLAYNKDDPKNLYRPWGVQPGHQTEWAKLLLQLHRLAPDPALLERAAALFDRAFALAWDAEHGGLVYGYDLDGQWCDDDKYFWVQAESMAAAALLYQNSGEPRFLTAYRQLWQYSWQHFVDHQHGAWYRLLNRQNQRLSDEKSSSGAKCDYHTLCACLDVLAGWPAVPA
jgi:mannose/cellobiose epimerase-like protein (N-acyl-D-glucosamine 2-epimerase family)